MENVKLAVTKRTPGKTSVREVRKNGYLPIEIYGKAVESNISGSVVHKEIVKALRTPFGKNVIIDLAMEDGTIVKGLPYQLQIDPVKNKIQHIDFMAVKENEPVIVTVPVVKTGRSKAEVVGGKVFVVMKEIKVSCKPEHIPANITIDVTPYEIGTRLNITDVTYPEGVTPVFAHNTPVIVINKGRGQGDEDAAPAAGAAPAAAAPKAAEKKK